MRNRKEAIEYYMTIYKKLTQSHKHKLACFEGQKFFRFGNSWRRLSFNGLKTAVLNDDEEKILII